MSARNALEFMEFVSFADGKIIVMFRQFLHTADQSLPVLACARLHSGSQLPQTLGPILMRADIFEAANCPSCGQSGKQCYCTFDSYAPNSAVVKSTFTWTHFTGLFMRKARLGRIKLRMTACLPDVGELEIMDSEVSVLNVLQKGDTEYMALLRRKAVHGLGVNVVMPQTDIMYLASAVENDFLDLHNTYVTRKRVREIDPVPSHPATLDDKSIDLTDAYSLLQATTGTSDSLQSIDLAFSDLPPIFSPGPSPSILATNNIAKKPIDVAAMAAAMSHATNNTYDIKLEEDSAKVVMNPSIPLGAGDTISSSARPPVPQAQQSNSDFLADIDEILSSSPVSNQTNGSQDAIPMDPPVQVLSFAPQTKVTAPVSNVTSEESSVPSPHREVQIVKAAKRTKRRVQTADDGTDEEKKHACTRCTSRFKMRGDLLRHVKTVHEGKKMFTCETCGKAFGHSGHLNRHISSVHLRQRRFKCEYCGFQFFQASHLQSHIGHIHNGKKPFECKKCGLRVLTENELKKHIESAHSLHAEGNSVWQCPFPECGTNYALESQLQMHVLTVHQNLNVASVQAGAS